MTQHIRTFGERYVTVRRLKDGHGITTLLARDTVTGDEVIVKTTSSPAYGAAGKQRLAMQADALRRAGSPWTASAIDVGDEAGTLYIVLPYVPGVSLQQRLADGRLSVSETLSVASCLLRGLDAAHGAGVLHRDVKPANIIVPEGPARNATLIDFGLARTRDVDPAGPASPVGTARYMSPEQAGLLDNEPDARSDLYSLGIVLYECLAGRPPFVAAGVGEILRQHLTAPPPALRSMNAEVPETLQAVIAHLLRKDPRDRYQTAAGALADVTAIADAIEDHRDPQLVPGRHDRRKVLTEPAFVGRRRPLAQLRAAVDDAVAGHGVLIAVEAESGGGKTRLLDELVAQIGPAALVLRGQGAAHAARRPVEVLADIAGDVVEAARADGELRSGLLRHVGSDADAVCAALPELAEVFGHRIDQAPEAHAEQRTTRALTILLDALGSASRPAVVILDDLQWADGLTYRLLDRWARQPGPRHVTVVAAFRSEEAGADHPLRSLSGRHVRLAPLSADDVQSLVQSMAGPLPAEALEVVQRLCDGSPFMASAIMRGLVESSALVAGETGWKVAADAMAAVRSSRQAAAFLARRLDLLPASALRLMEAGAVLGKRFDLELAHVLAGQPLSDALPAAQEARKRHILWIENSSCVFVHDKIREALLDRLDAGRLRNLHLDAALLHEQDAPDRVFDLAYHFHEAGEVERALPYAVIAGEQARARHDLETAEAQYRMAGQAAASAGPAMRLRIHEGLGDVLMLRGSYEEASMLLRQALEETSEQVSRATIEAKLAELAFKRGDLTTAGTIAENALRQLGQRAPRGALGFAMGVVWEIAVQTLHTLVGRIRHRHGPASERELLVFRLYSRLAHVYWFERGSVATLWAHLREMNLAERHPPTAELAQAYSEHAPAMALIPWFSRGIAYADRSLRIREQLDDVWGQGQSLNFLGVAYYNAGRFDDCLDACSRAAELLERMGDRWELNIARIHVGFAQYRKGRLAEAVETARRLVADGSQIGDPQASGIGLEIWSKATGGRIPSDALHADMARGTRDVQLATELAQAEAVRLLGLDDPAGAADALERARMAARRAGLRQEYVASVRPWLATARRMQAEAHPLYDPRRRRRLLRAAAHATRSAVWISRSYRSNLPHALREAGLVAGLRGRESRARRLLQDSIAWAVRLGAEQEHALSLQARGEAGIALGWDGADRDLQQAAERLRAIDPERSERPEPASAAVSLSMVDRFDTVLEAGRSIASALSTQAIFAAVRCAATTLLRGERCVILRMDPEHPDDPTLESGELQTGYSRDLAKRSLDARRPIVAGDVDELSEDASLSGVRSAISAPIFVRGRAVACLYVDHRQVQGLFGPEEEQLAGFIATLAGAALENAEGFAEVRELTRSLERRVAERTEQLTETNRALDSSLRKLQEAYEREREIARKLRELDELKSDFLSTVSHELRTPLTSISGFSETLMQRWTVVEERARRDFVRRIATNAATLNQLISELLDFARLERGQLRLDIRPLELAPAVARVVEGLERTLSAHRIDVEVPPAVVVLADASALSRILENLLTNAAKFSPAGSVIRVGCEDATHQVTVNVTDQGVGIAPEEHERIFERFYRVNRTDGAARGTGIGLAIVKQYVEALGGSVGVQSTLGVGSTFAFTLPCGPRPGEIAATAEAAASAHGA